MRAMVEEQIESESHPFVLSGRLYDDGVIDPRDTRPALGLCLAAIYGSPGTAPPGPCGAAPAGQPGAGAASRYGIFRL